MSWIVWLFFAYVLLCAFMFFMQRSLLYPAGRDRPDLASYGRQDIAAVTTSPEADVTLTHWYRPPRGPQADRQPVVVMFHGNAGHIGDRVDKHRQLLDTTDFGVLFVGYRGYGGNPGKPSQEGLTADARSVMAWLEEQGISDDRIVILGESLGSAVAVQIAAERPVAAVVLEAPMSSIADVAQAHYWYLPARWLLLDKWDSKARIADIDAPLLVVHGGKDAVVPQRFGRRLFDAAVSPKEALYIDDGQHSDLFSHPQVFDRVVRFIDEETGEGAKKPSAEKSQAMP